MDGCLGYLSDQAGRRTFDFVEALIRPDPGDRTVGSDTRYACLNIDGLAVDSTGIEKLNSRRQGNRQAIVCQGCR